MTLLLDNELVQINVPIIEETQTICLSKYNIVSKPKSKLKNTSVLEQNLGDSKLHVAVTVLWSLSIIDVQKNLTPLTSALIMSRRAYVPDLLSPRILLYS